MSAYIVLERQETYLKSHLRLAESDEEKKIERLSKIFKEIPTRRQMLVINAVDFLHKEGLCENNYPNTNEVYEFMRKEHGVTSTNTVSSAINEALVRGWLHKHDSRSNVGHKVSRWSLTFKWKKLFRRIRDDDPTLVKDLKIKISGRRAKRNFKICYSCYKKSEDLYEYRGSLVCGECLCPDFPEMTVESFVHNGEGNWRFDRW